MSGRIIGREYRLLGWVWANGGDIYIRGHIIRSLPVSCHTNAGDLYFRDGDLFEGFVTSMEQKKRA